MLNKATESLSKIIIEEIIETINSNDIDISEKISYDDTYYEIIIKLKYNIIITKKVKTP